MKGYQLLIAALLLGVLSAFVLHVPDRWRISSLLAGRIAGGRRGAVYRADDEHYRFKYLPTFAVLTIPLSFVPLPAAKSHGSQARQPCWPCSSPSALACFRNEGNQRGSSPWPPSWSWVSSSDTS